MNTRAPSSNYFHPLTGIIFSLLFIFIVSACKKKPADDRIIARVYDKILYAEDIRNFVSPGLSRSDSLAIVKQYVDNWIRRQAVIKKAEDNLEDDSKDVELRLEEYRNSLITYIYESELVSQKLDTTIGDTEIEKYYNDHPQYFQLKNNIVQANYFKLPKTAPRIEKVRSWYRSSKSNEKKLLEEYCFQFATEYYFNDADWLMFDDLVQKVPIQTYNQEQFLKNNRFIEIPDSNGVYFVEIKGFKIKESPSPLEFAKDDIRNLILNRRKLDLIREMEKDAYQDALQQKEIESWLPAK